MERLEISPFFIKMNTEIEIWKDIPGYEGLYQCSSFGNIKKYYKNGKTKILKPFLHKEYFQYRLSKESFLKSFRAHKLVAMTFLNHIPCGHKIVVDHINNNKLDNRLINLQLTTQRNNSSKDTFRYNPTSNYIGVYWSKNSNKWASQIMVNGKTIGLGYYKNETEAHEAYQKALNMLKIEDLSFTNCKYSSKYKGVYFEKCSKKWASQIIINGKNKKLGRFKTEYEAHLAYQSKIKEIYDEKELSDQIKSLTERANSILDCVFGLNKILKDGR